jgi:4,5-DOPA dioxygenase extradiol
MQGSCPKSVSTGGGLNISMPAVFVNHGGGPYPILDAKDHHQMHHNLQQINKLYPNPKAIVVVSAHWEEK